MWGRLVSAVAALTMLVLAGCGSASEATRTEGNRSEVVTGESDGSAASPTEGESAEEPAAEAALSVVEYGFTQLPEGEYGTPPGVTYAAILANAGSAIATNARVQLTFTDANGAVVTSKDEYLTAVLPGGKAALGDALYDVAGVTAMSVQVLPGDSEPMEEAMADFAVSQVTTVEQEYGGLKTTATVTSPFAKDLTDLLATVVYRGADGAIIGGAFTYLSFVPAKGSAGVEVISTVDGVQPAATEVYVQLSSLSLLD